MKISNNYKKNVEKLVNHRIRRIMQFVMYHLNNENKYSLPFSQPPEIQNNIT